ncbi:hypothetical protein SISSUDRAFT_1021374 [Sistotremastrum suecicum HHB10207 ss-3]|uniref:Uncharacterized protein n=1 Tax=Sistotremastrum suecicum HHB10207 ss-3 TaxID=1314776 RepID=A0A166DFU9_9AGAM|nr:hypothetical protein SISSUDRAFT_1021374 [Sistotremastrum suecicum HHB10207 ss-3]
MTSGFLCFEESLWTEVGSTPTLPDHSAFLLNAFIHHIYHKLPTDDAIDLHLVFFLRHLFRLFMVTPSFCAFLVLYFRSQCILSPINLAHTAIDFLVLPRYCAILSLGLHQAPSHPDKSRQMQITLGPVEDPIMGERCRLWFSYCLDVRTKKTDE